MGVFWENKIAERIKYADENPEERYSIDQVMSAEEYESFRRIEPDSIADEDFFEDE
ncbi:hypothetical protein JNUCC1_02258 [Lentibacillus sp. JNUCC-1]|uniref:hypothetical protein n=1 Tax=Lentibacillus sp. JNUCC-1 TaxID=2654513 RepID=UPI0012E91FB3|nr:hypothetical protein [Lentibacillus sp. JNUCC-1]MUV38420.1 hypothetical protein [Lentibacillus sp. JNUCC-1]